VASRNIYRNTFRVQERRLLRFTAVVHFELHNLIVNYLIIYSTCCFLCRSQWSRGRRRRTEPANMLRLWVSIPPEAWMFVCCECCALSGRGICDELITRPEESYQMWCIVVRDLETSGMRRPWPTGVFFARKNKQPNFFFYSVTQSQLLTNTLLCVVLSSKGIITNI